jgi:sugar phosphate isomerase/epimerase
MAPLAPERPTAMTPISIQLYSLRDAAQKDFRGVLQAVADIGYKGVEAAGFHGLSPAEFRKIVEDLGMEISGSHGPWAVPENVSEVIETMRILGLDMAATGFGPSNFADLEAILLTADKVNSVIQGLEPAGIQLFIHNHYWEFERLNGRLKYDLFLERSPKLKLEIDTYWAANFGVEDPAEHVARHKERTVLLHIKDGPLVKGKAHVAVGSGKMNIPSVVNAADPKVLRWLVVEIDHSDTDVLTAVRESYQYLTQSGLALGNK